MTTMEPTAGEAVAQLLDTLAARGGYFDSSDGRNVYVLAYANGAANLPASFLEDLEGDES